MSPPLDATLCLPSDHQETATTEHSDKFPSVRETAKQVQPAQEEEEEEEEEDGGDKTKETTEENSRGSNWRGDEEQGKTLGGMIGGVWGKIWGTQRRWGCAVMWDKRIGKDLRLHWTTDSLWANFCFAYEGWGVLKTKHTEGSLWVSPNEQVRMDRPTVQTTDATLTLMILCLKRERRGPRSLRPLCDRGLKHTHAHRSSSFWRRP